MRKLLAGSLFALITGCIAGPGTQGSTQGTQDTQGGAGSSATPHLQVRLTDAPAAFQSVFVNISRVEIGTSSNSWVTLSDQPQQFDLLTLQNDATALLGGGALAPGSYTQLRLIVDSASVVLDGVSQALKIASGTQTGIKLNLDAEVVAGMTYTLVIDYDAGKSIKTTGKGFLMTPVIKVKSLTGTPIPDSGGGSDAGGSDSGSGSGSGSGDGSGSGSDGGDGSGGGST